MYRRGGQTTLHRRPRTVTGNRSRAIVKELQSSLDSLCERLERAQEIEDRESIGQLIAWITHTEAAIEDHQANIREAESAWARREMAVGR